MAAAGISTGIKIVIDSSSLQLLLTHKSLLSFLLGLALVQKWGVFSYAGLHGNRVERWNENMAISNQQNMHVAGSRLLTLRPLALLWPHCQGKWFLNVGSLGSLCAHVSQKQPIYFRCFVCSCSCYLSLLFFSFPFLLLLFNIIKITNMTHYSVLISSEIWQLVVG